MHHKRIITDTPAHETDFEELVQLIEAVPRRFRPRLVSAALQFQPAGTIKASHFVGMYRTRLFDCVISRHGLVSVTHWRQAVSHAQQRLQKVVTLLAQAPDLLAVRSVLADVLQIITDRVDLEIPIELPGPSERADILRDALGVVEQFGIFPLTLKGPGRQAAGGLGRLVKATDRFSGRDLRHLVVEALTLRDGEEPLKWNHLIRAVEIKLAMNQRHTNNKGGYLHDYE